MWKRFLNTFICFFVLYVDASIADHLKPALGKSNIHRMRNIDFIYMINLDQRPEKFQKCIDQLHPFGIYPYRFSAVNGWELTLEDINDVGVKFAPGMEGGFMGTSYLQENIEPSHEEIHTYGQTYFCHCEARGTMGILLSHLSVLQDAFDSGYETIWVMEDDIEVIRDPRLVSSYINYLDRHIGKNKWDIFFTDRDQRDANGRYVPSLGMARRPDFHPENMSQYYIRRRVGPRLARVGSRFGGHSMILRRSGVQKILEFLKTHQMFFPYDMEYYLPEGIKIYVALNDIVSNQLRCPSDNGGPNYLKR